MAQVKRPRETADRVAGGRESYLRSHSSVWDRRAARRQSWGAVQFRRALGAVLGVGSCTGGGRGRVGGAREERAVAVEAALCAQTALVQEFDGGDGVPVVQWRVQIVLVFDHGAAQD